MSSLFEDDKEVSLFKERIKILKSEVNSLDAQNSFLQCSLFSSYQTDKEKYLNSNQTIGISDNDVQVNELIDEIL